MAREDHVERLRAIPLFAELDEPALEQLADCTTEVEFPAGSVLIERGQPGSGMFVILAGTARVELPGRAADLGAGEVVGELSFLTEDPQRSVRVRAGSDLRCLALSRADFWRLLEAEPRLALPLLSVLARRLLDMISGGQSESD